jgi:hypothetical protein
LKLSRSWRRQRQDFIQPRESATIARKPNYNFERQERDRLKAIKVAEKAAAKREQRERDRAGPDAGGPETSTDDEA